MGYVDPDDFTEYTGIITASGEKRPYKDLFELCAHIESYRDSQPNLAPIENLQVVVEDYLYRLREAPHSLFYKDKAKVKRSLLQDMKTGINISLALSKAAGSGESTASDGGWVNKTIATERGRICTECPENDTETSGSLIQRAADKLAHVYTTKRSTPHDTKLGKCGVCECPMYIKNHFSGDLIREVTAMNEEPDQPEDFPKSFIGINSKETEYCWMRKVLNGEPDESV